jgi:phosphatidylglycerophosphate synthase
MSTLAALVFDDGVPLTVGGMTLAERAMLLAHRAGLDPVYVWGPRALDLPSAARLRAQGVTPVQQRPDAAPLDGTADDGGTVVIGPGVLFGPTLLPALVNGLGSRAGADATVTPGGAAPLLMYLPRDVRAEVRTCRSVDAMAASLRDRGAVRELPLNGLFCRRVGAADAAAVERDYIRHLTGKGESYFTKKIRRFSVPLTTRLIRLGMSPTQVTLGGLVLAVVSAWCIAQGNYAAGVLGALLYYTSMIFDCSDGEVARVTLREGPFGAWLETAVDYVTYVLILAAITIASQMRPHAEAYRMAAAMALFGTVIVIIVAGYLRHRVAAADPGQFDDASAKALAGASGVHRFARWGRQWIKRSTVAHLLVFLALVNQLPALLYLWAFGATVASVVILIVEPFVVRRVSVGPAGHLHGA